MPRIPRRSEGSEEAPPEDQRTQVSSGDPLAPPTPAPQSAATSGDPLTKVVPPSPPEQNDLSAAPPVTPASTAAPSEAEVAPGDASNAQATDAPAESAGAASTGATTPNDTDQPTVAAPAVEQPTAVVSPSGDPLVTPQPTAETGEVDAGEGEQAPVDARPRFRQRTRMRRRLRYLRRLRELAFRDLGGLVFDLHRFGRDRNDLVTAKLEALATIDRELRVLQDALHDRQEFTDLREAGIAACPRCGTLHDTDANYCPGCGSTLRSVLVRQAFPVTVTPADEQQPPPQQPTPSP